MHNKIIEKLKDKPLPYLLQYYKDNYPLYLEEKYEKKYNEKNNLNEHFEAIIKEAIKNA